jgi:polysaccharide pyruvyl transferase WcaK-like protein
VNIEIKGVQFVNKGAELMLAAVVARIKEYWPDADIVLEGNPLSPYKERALLGAYQKLSLRKNVIDLNFLAYYLPKSLRSYMKKWGIITEADIDVVLDAAGFAYGDQWGALKIKHLGGELKRYKKNGCKYIFLPQALGPFSRQQDQRVLKDNLQHAALICARDDDSLKHIQSIVGVLPNLHQLPDFTNAVKGITPDYWKGGENKICFVPNNSMIGVKNPNADWKNNYLKVMTLLMTHAQELGYQPVLLNHEGVGDRDICQILNQAFDNKLELIEELDPLKVKGILGNSKAVVCSRFHGCVSALSQGVPNLGTSWSHKYEHLYSEYGVADLLINPNASDQELLELMDSILLDGNEYSTKISQNAKKYKLVTEQLWSLVKDEINGCK